MTKKYVDRHKKEDVIPFVACMGCPYEHPIFNKKVVWCPYQLQIKGLVIHTKMYS